MPLVPVTSSPRNPGNSGSTLAKFAEDKPAGSTEVTSLNVRLLILLRPAARVPIVRYRQKPKEGYWFTP